MKQNTLARRLQSGSSSFGGWSTIPGSFVAELVAAARPDYVCIDLQHGLSGFSDLAPALQAVALHGPTPLVRIPVGDLATAQRALDAGAEGVIFPMISTRAQAVSAVEACRYPPAGRRSFGPIRSRLHLGDDPAAVNAEVLCIVMIETNESLANLDAIIATPGVDAVYVGPSDLALALGLPVGSADERLEATLERILSACGQHGLPAGIHTPSGEAAARALKRGFRMATVASDAALLAARYRSELAEARSAFGEP